MSTNFMIVGAGGFGYELLDWIKCYRPSYNFLGFWDDNINNSDVLGVIDDISYRDAVDSNIFCAVGSGELRKLFALKLSRNSIIFDNLISPSSQLASSCNLGPGVILLGNSSVAANSNIGQCCLIQGFSVIGHDVLCGDFVSIYSFVFVGGGAVLGDGVTLYPHSVILPNVKVGENSIVGAGSIVVSDVPDNVTVFGAPAKIIKKNN